MVWATFLLTLASAYVAIKLVRLTSNRVRLKYLGLTIAASIFTIMQLGLVVEHITQSSAVGLVSAFLLEWGHVVALAFVLSSLAAFIRESKPVFAQFPLLYTAFPLLIVVSYILVQDTYALKRWLVGIYQGGAILVSLLMYGVYSYHRKEYTMVLAGVVLFLLSFGLFWYVPGMDSTYLWVCKILLGVAMVMTVLGYEYAEPKSTSVI